MPVSVDEAERCSGLHHAGSDGRLDRGAAIGVGIEIDTERGFVALERLDIGHRIVKRPIALALRPCCDADDADFVPGYLRLLGRLEGGALGTVDARRPFPSFTRRELLQEPADEMMEIRPR